MIANLHAADLRHRRAEQLTDTLVRVYLEVHAGEGFTDEDDRRTFAISELLVRANARRQGVAQTLHDRLLGSHIEERATLLVRPDNAITRRGYDSWGWTQEARLRPGWENARVHRAYQGAWQHVQRRRARAAVTAHRGSPPVAVEASLAA
ncbi:hypothetical protein [Micromonospora sp. NPDC003816]|uniref:hypothetical protein n=1 Tax=Micromonospora sp. NPDC003816 TaxID=3364224 RepID=UPI0036ADFE6A